MANEQGGGITRQTWIRGFKNGFKTSWFILRIMLPVYAAVTILGHTPVVRWLGELFTPLMSLTGLPGGAAIAFVTGSLVNIYAAMGIILALQMTPYQITVLAVMLNISHELPVESAVLRSAGVNPWPVVGVRVAGAYLVGVVMHFLGLWWGV